jgi:hypothetical protein
MKRAGTPGLSSGYGKSAIQGMKPGFHGERGVIEA